MLLQRVLALRVRAAGRDGRLVDGGGVLVSHGVDVEGLVVLFVVEVVYDDVVECVQVGEAVKSWTLIILPLITAVST